MTEPLSPRPELFASPAFLAAIALLLLNDHVLKGAWPGLVTGKLSDVAGVSMVAIALTAASGTRPLSFGVTAVGFSVLKTIPVVAVWAAPLLGGVTRTDPTDLIALLGLVPLWFVIGTRSAHPSRDALTNPPLRIVAVTGAVLATTATSCGPGGVWGLNAVDGVAYARAESEVWESTNGGATWESSDVDVADARFDGAGGEGCAGGRCFELDFDGEVPAVIEVGDNDTERALLTWDAGRRAELSEAVDWSCGDGSLSGLMALEHDGNVSVVVSMIEAGTLLWSSGSESWSWVAVGGWGLEGDEVAGIPIGDAAAGPGLTDRNWLVRGLSLLTTIAAFAAAPAVGRLARSRNRHSPSYSITVVLIAAASMIPLAAFWLLPFDWRLGAGPERLGGAIVVAAIVAAAVGFVAWLASRPRPALAAPVADNRVG